MGENEKTAAANIEPADSIRLEIDYVKHSKQYVY
jgi:hypothetical protein